MSRRTTKGETVLIGIIAIIAIIVALINYVISLIFTYWYVIGGFLLFTLILLLIDDYLNYRKNKKKIEELNSKAANFRNNILKDYQNLISTNGILNIFDNAINHFPKRTFLEPEYLSIFEVTVLSGHNELTQLNEAKNELDSYTYYLNKAGIILFKPKILFDEIIPTDFLIRASNNDPTFFELSNVNEVENFADYKMFEDLVCSRYKFSSLTSRYYCIWKLLKDRACKYYSTIWDNKYSNIFETAPSADLFDLVKCYCNILFINHLDAANIAMFTYFLMDHKINPDEQKFREYYAQIEKFILLELEERRFQNFEKKLTNTTNSSDELIKKYTINDTDFMNGYQFENFVALLFNHFGYRTIITPSSGDQGIDVIAEKDGEKVGIQAKCYSTVVSNSAIQEVTAGIRHHNCSKGIVVTNNNFTKSAIALAESNQIILWNRQKLSEIINQIFE